MPRSPMINRRPWAQCAANCKARSPNILGYGDILAAQYGRSQGLNDGYVGYSLPIANDDTRLSLRYDKERRGGDHAGAQPTEYDQQLFERRGGTEPPDVPNPRTDLYARRELRKAAAANV